MYIKVITIYVFMYVISYFIILIIFQQDLSKRHGGYYVYSVKPIYNEIWSEKAVSVLTVKPGLLSNETPNRTRNIM